MTGSPDVDRSPVVEPSRSLVGPEPLSNMSDIEVVVKLIFHNDKQFICEYVILCVVRETGRSNPGLRDSLHKHQDL